MNVRKIFTFLFLMILSYSNLDAQKSFRFTEELTWKSEKIQLSNLENGDLTVYSFDGSFFSHRHPQVPLYSKRFEVSGPGSIAVVLKATTSEPVQLTDPTSLASLTDDFRIYGKVYQSRGQHFGNINLFPYRIRNGQVERLNSFTIEATFNFVSQALSKGPEPTFNSVLETGTVYKLQISETGVYKIDRAFLSNLGINPDNIDPRNISIYGNGGGLIPELVSEERWDDLQENHIVVEGEADGIFNNNDRVLFYAQGPDVWAHNDSSGKYEFQKNIYDTNNYYFLKINTQPGLRVSNLNQPSNSEYTSSSYDDTQRYEVDTYNLLGSYGSTEGSGKHWYGDKFDQQKNQQFGSKFDFSDILLNEPVLAKMEFAGRSANNQTLEFKVGNQSFNATVFKVAISNVESRYANKVSFNQEVTLNSETPEISVKYNATSGEGWLDYIEIQCRKSLNLTGTAKHFRDYKSSDFNSAAFQFTGSKSIWDVTYPLSVKKVMSNGNQFNYNTENLVRTFYAFDAAQAKTPTYIGVVENQNLHGLQTADLIIIYHPEFKVAAEKLASHRRDFSNLDVYMTPVEKVYNEFSSGRQTPTAIRDFSKLIHNRSSNYKYLLLIGDGSYDFRKLVNGLPNHNFIPVYETEESLSPIEAFPSDDYFALLSEADGNNLIGEIDLGVGRLPVSSEQQAIDVVNKIIHYDLNKDCLGDWRLRIGFTADDEDSNTHYNQTESIAKNVALNNEIFNQQKVYFDAFVQESTPGGDRYPSANAALNNNIFKGQLILNYLGHGGPKGWAQERVLQVSDVLNWKNINKLPLMVTATCSFTGYDDPALVSAGEHAIRNPNGGVVALFTTVRAVYASDNKRLTEAVFNHVFDRVDGIPLSLGDIMVLAKNENSADTLYTNSRKFAIIGDPSMQLAIPNQNIVTTEIKGNPISAELDTLRALEEVTIKGYIANAAGQVDQSFNGTVTPTIFDKISTLETLANDPEEGYRSSFKVYRNVIFKGAASVINGQFSFTFVVPKDINYSFGNGRISYYAHNGNDRDAGGVFTDFIVGGSKPGGIADDQGPLIEPFMNDENFVFGGITDDNPELFIKLEDDFGINVSGTSIGHDLVAVLDDNSQETFILNEYYEADVDNYKKGTVRFPLKDLTKGKHTISVKAWDIANNSTEARTEFLVVDSEDAMLEHVLNFPNPFTTKTNFNFEHDLAGASLDVLVQIYSISGKVVKTIQATRMTTGYRVNDVEWNGRDDFGSKLAKGVYLYKIKVRSDELNISRESDFEKLVIL